MDHDATDLAPTDAPTDTPTDARAVDTTEPTAVTVDELLIEEISIDGMCGVY